MQDAATGILTLELNDVIRAHYGQAGPRFVRHLLKQRHKWDDIRQHYDAEIKRYRDSAPGSPEADRPAQSCANRYRPFRSSTMP